MIRELLNLHGRTLGYGWCLRCGGTWNWKHGHNTPFDETRGCFPLCDECWSMLAPSERVVYYDRMVDGWIESAWSEEVALGFERDRELIRTAVLAGG